MTYPMAPATTSTSEAIAGIDSAFAWSSLMSPYAVTKIDSVRNTITVSTLAEARALALVKRRHMNATAFQKNARAVEIWNGSTLMTLSLPSTHRISADDPTWKTRTVVATGRYFSTALFSTSIVDDTVMWLMIRNITSAGDAFPMLLLPAANSAKKVLLSLLSEDAAPRERAFRSLDGDLARPTTGRAFDLEGESDAPVRRGEDRTDWGR
mmetsp:Transcript_59077/g.140535  ORF Transcript_59077/g.140535 Transcript_59077/m.140535 type:complete len:210 (-) Transcript_59077:103-732(-)